MAASKKSMAVSEIPEHLKPFVTEQNYSLYTAIDQAAWRYIMRVSKSFFKKFAHPIYLSGLEKTGIPTERIPKISEMDLKLRKFGWRAVGVVGFIPPAAFMEFQSLGILPIACDMRSLEHLGYTPAPDIVHEAAGHAPILADPGYAGYLKKYGEIARKAIFSRKDMNLYDAIRLLSDTKENPASTDKDVADAQFKLDMAAASVDYVSEATYLARMNWWTSEYGLVGPLDRPKIFGAGLLSSVGESFNCLKPEVKKIPFTLDCLNTVYDITRPQPQLFVTENWSVLSKNLIDFSKTMAYQVGGMPGLAKGKIAGTLTTTVLNSGLQISGVIEDFLLNKRGLPDYLRLSGPVQLSYNDIQLDSQGPKTHNHGFSCPLGRIKKGKLTVGKECQIEFESGIKLKGIYLSSVKKAGKVLIHRFDRCSIFQGQTQLYKPEWGRFDLACGSRVVSVFGGAADRALYLEETGGFKQKPAAQHSNLTSKNQNLERLYSRVRTLREKGSAVSVEQLGSELENIHRELALNHKSDWLLRLEVVELARSKKISDHWVSSLKEEINRLGVKSNSELIQRGLEVLQT